MHGFCLHILYSSDNECSKGLFYFYYSLLFLHHLSGKGSSFTRKQTWTELLLAVSDSPLEHWSTDPPKPFLRATGLRCAIVYHPDLFCRYSGCFQYYDRHHEQVCSLGCDETLDITSWLTSNKWV